MTRTLAPELQEIYNTLTNEGHEVYTYTFTSMDAEEILCLCWFENGRVLNIQQSTWYNARYARDLFTLSNDYVPTRENGSGCRLSPEDTMGTHPADLLTYRHTPTWVHTAKQYRDMPHFLKLNKHYHKI